jgi:hypothetical protein
MTKRIIASELGLDPHYKVRVVLPGVCLHLASKDEPKIRRHYDGGGGHWDADWIDDPRYGDTVGFIDWASVVAITWRRSE